MHREVEKPLLTLSKPFERLTLALLVIHQACLRVQQQWVHGLLPTLNLSENERALGLRLARHEPRRRQLLPAPPRLVRVGVGTKAGVGPRPGLGVRG